ncbi:uncharacterized protein LOC123211806 isoform X2 [Mangifera indica]|nr:uncharacterized protein LOC123211806 isoform X2 [Mangifera indica]
MARKGNQQKNGLNRHRKKGSNSGSAVPDMTGWGRDSNVKVFPQEDLPDGNHQGIPFVDSASKAHHAGDENKRKQNCGASPRKEKQGTDLQGIERSVSSKGNCSDEIGNISLMQTPNIREVIACRGRKHGKSGLGCLLNGLHFKNAMEDVKLPDNALVRSLRAHVLSKLKAAFELLERLMPLFVSLTTNFYNALDYVRIMFQQVYPVVLIFLKHLASVLLLLSMVWLDCALRGIDSFLRMGTTSFFSVIWCSILSVIAMVGMSKFLMVLVICALVAFFSGFTLAIMVVALLGTVYLWIYGSFWTTVLVIFLGGLAFKLSHESLALLITTLYSIYCAWTYVGWLGLLLALNLSFVSSDALIYFLRNNINQQRRMDGRPHEQTFGMRGGPGYFNGESRHASSSDNAPEITADCSAGVPSTSGADSEMTSEDEVARLLNCPDHYSALGLSRYENVDVSVVKREYRKRAMLVHPDKNMGNEKAVEAFKKLQNAYEVLLDSLKRKAYDDELRREELLNCFRRFQSASQKNGRHGFFASKSARSETDSEDPIGDSRQIACKKCNNFHLWIETKRTKSQARWCQECKDYHLAKDGDGWVEQSSQPFFFGLLQKVDLPSAYVCADSKIYNATEWYICQGMRCPANTHKPSFHVNTCLTSKHSTGKGTSSGQRGGWMPTSNLDETMTEEEFVEWLQNAVQSGLFDNFGASTSSESPTTSAGTGFKGSGAFNSSGNKRKKKGKKQ